MYAKLRDKQKWDNLWMKLMEIGEKAGCHQRPDRSFFIKGYQLPICARCTGAVLGYTLAIPLFLLFGFSLLMSWGGIVLMFIDWLLQTLRIRESTNRRRLITGILGGYGMMSVQFMLLQILSSLCFSKNQD